MTLLLIAVAFAALIIIGIEIFKFSPLYMGALTLTAIAFIYVGFAGSNYEILAIESAQALLMLMLSYYAITKQPLLIAFGLILHAIWDALHLWFNPEMHIPENYEVLCVLVDSILAVYFYLKLKK